MQVGSLQRQAFELIKSDTHFGAALPDDDDDVKIIEILTQRPELANQLTQTAFDQVIQSVHTSSHRDATTVFEQLLRSSHMETMDPNDFNMLLIDFSGTGLPHFPKEEEIRERVILLLNSDHIGKAHPTRLKQLRINFQMAGADTKRIEALLEAIPKPTAPPPKSWCSLV